VDAVGASDQSPTAAGGDVKRIAIVGCRPPTPLSGDQLKLFFAITKNVGDFVNSLPGTTVIISGGADGVDEAAEACARCRRLSRVIHEPLNQYDAASLKARNTLIVRDCDELHAWPAQWSRGTWDTVRKAREAGKPVTVHEVTL
jgi:hypothetical protein